MPTLYGTAEAVPYKYFPGDLLVITQALQFAPRNAISCSRALMATLPTPGGHPLNHLHTHKRLRRFAEKIRLSILPFCICAGMFAFPARATELKPETVAAFDRYVAAAEARMDNDLRLDQFLAIDRLPDVARQEAYDQLQRGQAYIEELHAEEDHHSIRIPSGLIHHWVGAMLIPKGTLAEAIAVLRDYEDQPNIYRPEVRRAKLIVRNGNESRVYLQFYNKSILTVVLDAYFNVVETPLGSERMVSTSHSTRIVEVANVGSPDERERAGGNDRGYMWRLNSYWRIEEKDGGVYIQDESITLTRTVPVLLAWLVNPLVKSIPREVLLHTLTNTRKAVLNSQTEPKHKSIPQVDAAAK